jgi:pyruvate dehydrogenase E2 component (dihydrolipoamide acetyltransferase)
MANEITIPRLGWNTDKGVFVAWLKNDGDFVQAGEPIFSLENDKAVQEIESLVAGTLRISPDSPKPGDTLPIGTVIGHIVPPGETADDTGEPPAENAAIGPTIEPKTPSSSHAEDTGSQTAVERAPQISSRARRKAQELGIDWTGVRGSGASGKILERDVLAAAPLHEPGAITTPNSVAEGEFQVIPVDATRRTIAERMMRNAHGTAPVTLMTSIDATNLFNLRQQFEAVGQGQGGTAGAEAIGYTDIVVKLVALALERHPMLNARWHGDQILLFRRIHIGIAIDTNVGVLAPVIRDVPDLSLRQLAARAHDLIDRARRRALKVEELQGATFTVSNLGHFGVDAFTPIINLPQCAVLGLGRILRQAVVVDQQFAARDRMTLSLTFDHRVVDGAPAAQFLQTLGSLLENPSPWLVP